MEGGLGVIVLAGEAEIDRRRSRRRFLAERAGIPCPDRAARRVGTVARRGQMIRVQICDGFRPAGLQDLRQRLPVQPDVFADQDAAIVVFAEEQAAQPVDVMGGRAACDFLRPQIAGIVSVGADRGSADLGFLEHSRSAPDIGAGSVGRHVAHGIVGVAVGPDAGEFAARRGIGVSRRAARNFRQAVADPVIGEARGRASGLGVQALQDIVGIGPHAFLGDIPLVVGVVGVAEHPGNAAVCGAVILIVGGAYRYEPNPSATQSKSRIILSLTSNGVN